MHTFNENVPHKITHIVQYIFFPIVNNQLSIVNKKGIFAPEKECLLFRVLAKPRTKNKKDMKHKKEAALVCFSGGQDSTTCLFWAKKHFSRVEAVCFTYGQKHSLEIEVARKIAADADVPFQLLDVSLISQLDPNCSLTNTGISMDQEKPADSYPNTFVPGRNMVFLTFAAILARSKGIFNLVTGVSEADFSGYPDCRDTFVRSLNVTLNLAMDERFVIHTPLMDRDKSEVWELADELGVFDLVRTQTLTCYNGIMAEGCGHCPACKLRREGLDTRKNENELHLLGGSTVYKQDYAPEVLEAFTNKHPDNDYWVRFNCPEFTSLCPITGQPDFATIYIDYIPDIKMVESKSLKLYLFSFRNHGAFHEDCVNIIMKDLIRLMNPKYIEVTGIFTPRGGISIYPYCNYGRPGTKYEKLAEQRFFNHHAK